MSSPSATATVYRDGKKKSKRNLKTPHSPPIASRSALSKYKNPSAQ
jgi:hypothetical protein